MSVNPRKAVGGASNADVSLARVVFVDFDNVTVDEVRATLAATRLPAPTLIIASGHGVHVYWLLAEPITDLELWTSVQSDLANHLGSDPSVKDPARIMRLPGTRNHKLPAADCTIVESHPERVYDLADIIDVVPHVEPVAKPTPTPITHADVDNLTAFARAAKYLDAIPGAVEKSHGDDETYRVACKLVKDFALPTDQAWTLLQQWNARCSPPWSDAELREKLDNAVQYGTAPIGCKLTERPRVPGPTVRHTATDTEPAVEPIRPTFMDAVDLIDQHQAMREPIIDGLLRRGEVLNVIASPKTKKSWLVLNLLLSVATGRPWLKFGTVPGRVLLIDNELHRETLARRLPKVMAAMGVNSDEIAGRVAVESLRGRLSDIYQMAGYFAAIEPNWFDVIALDAWYRMQPRDSDENSNAAICAAYSQLDHYAEQTGAAFVVVHHSSKGLQSGKSVTDVGAGAGAQARAADSHLILREHAEPDCMVLDAAVRSWAPVEPVVLRWHWPTWNVAEGLDPHDLKQAKPRKKTQADDKHADVAVPAEPLPPPWTAERFAGAFVIVTPRPRAAIVTAAVEAGLIERRAVTLLDSAEAKGLVHRVRVPKDKRVFWATGQEAKLG